MKHKRSTLSIVYALFALSMMSFNAEGCDKESYITTPLPETPKMLVMDYPQSERADIFAERVAAMRLWVASNK